MGKRHEEMFYLKGYTDVKKAQEITFNIISHQEKANWNHNEISVQFCQNGENKKWHHLMLVRMWKLDHWYCKNVITQDNSLKKLVNMVFCIAWQLQYCAFIPEK